MINTASSYAEHMTREELSPNERLVLYALVGRLTSGATPAGWTSVFVAVAFLSGVQLVALGILGAYVSRIFEEVKGRPLYVVASDTAQRPIETRQHE